MKKMKKINLKIKYPRKRRKEIERKAEIKLKIELYNKFPGDVVGIDLHIPVTETEIRVLRKRRRNKLYYSRYGEAIHIRELRNYWQNRLNKATALNEPFKGCCGHHITRDFIVYIPAKLHRSIKHSLQEGSPYDMVKINKAVVDYLRAENKYATLVLVEEHLAPTQQPVFPKFSSEPYR